MATEASQAAKSLPYVEIYQKYRGGTISWEECIHHLLARCRGAELEEDNFRGVHLDLLEMDPFGYSIWCWSGRLKEVIEDTSSMEDVFVEYRHGSLATVEAKLNVLTEDRSKDVRKSLAMLALQERRADILKMCMDLGGFPYEGYFEDEANRVDEEKDPETFQVLENSEFRRVYPRREPPGSSEEESDSDTDSGVGYDDEEGSEIARDRAAATFDDRGKYKVYW